MGERRERAEMEGQMSSSVSVSSYHSFHRDRQNKKRKANSMRNDTDAEDESETCSSLRTATPTEDNSKKQNHSEIEKRRRDKMNTFITELSGIVPMCSAMSRKLDKLTVLRMAVQHMKTLRGSRCHSYTEGHYKPSFLTDQELFQLILQSAEGFLFVVGCDRGRLLYVSESVLRVLKFSQKDLLGQSWFDILHPKDVAKVKEQLSSSDVSPRERLIDAKTMLPVKASVPQRANRLCPGARRSFFCRMKCKASSGGGNGGTEVKEEADPSCHRKKKSGSERKYAVVHCTGYLKSWAKVGMDEGEGEMEDACNLSCLVAVGRILPPITHTSISHKHRPVTFISRHTPDGRFLFVDQRVTLVLGFLPQELLGSSMYEYFHSEDIGFLAEAHKAALNLHDDVITGAYQFRTRNSSFVRLNTTWKAFRNPWTKETEYLLARTTLMRGDISEKGNRSELFPASEFDFYPNNGNTSRDIQRLISCQMEASKIGKLIASQMDPGRGVGESSSSNSPEEVMIGRKADRQGCKEGTLCRRESIASPENLASFVPASTSVPLSMSMDGSGSSGLGRGGGLNKRSCLSPGDEEDEDCEDGVGEDVGGSGLRSGLFGLSKCGSSEGRMELSGSLGSDPISCFSAGPNGISLSLGGDALQVSQTQSVAQNTRVSSMNLGVNGVNVEDDGYLLPNEMLGGNPHGNLNLNVNSNTNSEGNDEAAMAVIMSLLEADAGLGGPVDFTGLPWPLP